MADPFKIICLSGGFVFLICLWSAETSLEVRATELPLDTPVKGSARVAPRVVVNSRRGGRR